MKAALSVIIPCRNGTNYLAEAVGSVRAQEVETEIIVVDDGSVDATAELAASLGCRVFRQLPSGPSRARNVGVHEAVGDFVMFLDHDDVLANGALRAMFEAFTEDTGIVASRLQDFISPELSADEAARLQLRPEPYAGLLTGAYLFRRGVPEAVGGFDEALTGGGEVVDFLLRCREHGVTMRQVEHVTCLRRVHMSNTGRVKPEAQRRDYATSLRARMLAGGRKPQG